MDGPCPRAIPLWNTAIQPTVCSGAGICDAKKTCNCTEGYEGVACEYKACPTGRAWWEEAVGNNIEDAHRSGATCSNRGSCDRSSGRCTCDSYFDVVYGDNCETMMCEVNATMECGAFGYCATMAELATNAIQFDDNGFRVHFNYSDPWDAHMVTGCHCHKAEGHWPANTSSLQYRGPFAYTHVSRV